MKKILILSLYCLIGHHNAMALPGRFSVGCAPCYVMNRVYSQMKPVPYDKGGALRLHFGGAYNLILQQYCSLGLGLSYALGYLDLVRDESVTPPSSVYEAYALHYLWLPILCRFYTSEVMIDTTIYFKLGMMPSLNLSTRPTVRSDPSQPPFLTLRPLTCFVVLGGGIKYDFSLTNSLTVGVSYCWDVAGVMHKKNANNTLTDCYCHNDFFCLDVGCLF